jgi:hypothetical protein
LTNRSRGPIHKQMREHSAEGRAARSMLGRADRLEEADPETARRLRRQAQVLLGEAA